MKYLSIVVPLALGAASLCAQDDRLADPAALMMDHEREIALARTAAPDNVAEDATILVLGTDGFREAVRGSNGFVCLVVRGTGAPPYVAGRQPHPFFFSPDIIAPTCLNREASVSILEWHKLKTSLALRGMTRSAIDSAVTAGLESGELRPPEGLALGYMWSPHTSLGPLGSWKPHMMYYVPFAGDHELGNNPSLGNAPFVNEDGTPWATVIVPSPAFTDGTPAS